MSAAVTEEIFFRLGLIALVSWVIASIVRRPAIHVLSLWVGNLVSALLFAAAHLPQLSGHAPGLQAALISYSTAAGLVMGAVFLRYGLVSAVVAHFTCDLVANVVPRLFATVH
jgi:membrane protease YdiL (CAAX protease family)